MQHPVDVHGLHARALRRGQQNAPQRIAERYSKPRSSGSATSVAERLRIGAKCDLSLFGRISSCQFFWIVTLTDPLALYDVRAFCGARRRHTGENGDAALAARRVMNYTRRRLRGRQPLCGMGVTSRIEVMVNPAACKARRVDSRPDPGPDTSTLEPCACHALGLF